VEGNVTSGDFLIGFYSGTRQALADNDSESLSITLKEISPNSICILIALFDNGSKVLGVND
jgi:glucose-6-phosphate isomerase